MAMKLQNLVNRTGYLSKLKNLYVLNSKPSCKFHFSYAVSKRQLIQKDQMTSALTHCSFLASPRKKVASPLFVISVSFSLLALIPFLFLPFLLGAPFFFFFLSLFGQTFLLPLLPLLLLLCLHTKRLWGWSYLSFIFLIEEREDELLEIGESDAMKTDF